MKDVILQLVMAFVGSLGFAMLFRLRQSLWVSASLGGVVCWGGYLLVMYFSNGQIFISGLAASALAAVYADFLAARKRAPVPLFLIPSVVPLIPGSTLYSSAGKYRRSVTLWQSDTSVCIVHRGWDLYRVDDLINFPKILCSQNKQN